jgi:undecaprenyl-diphosphatase
MIQELLRLDRSLFLFLNSFHSPLLNNLMIFLSGQAVWLPLIIASLWLARKQLGLKGMAVFTLFLLMAVAASDVTSSYIIKNFINRYRPCRELELKPLIYYFGQRCGGKFGFVSSHAANSFALLTFVLNSLRIKGWWPYSLWLLPVVISYSRIYLGVHYPGDILGGVIVGLFWGWSLSAIFRRSEFHGASLDNSQPVSDFS